MELHRDNTVRENTIAVGRVPIPEGASGVPLQINDPADSTVVGTPIAFEYLPLRIPGLDQDAGPGRFVGNTVEGNEILGAEGVGIHIGNGVRNRIVDNTIRSVAPQEPYPGNTLGADPSGPRANGSGIWLWLGSTENEVTGNTLSDIAGPFVTMEGTGNRVAVPDTTAVLDLGAGNEVSADGGGGV